MREVKKITITPRVKKWPDNVIPLNAWEVCVFPWGTAVRHRRGKWQKVFLNGGQEIDVSHMNVIIDEYGITFLLPEEGG